MSALKVFKVLLTTHRVNHETFETLKPFKPIFFTKKSKSNEIVFQK